MNMNVNIWGPHLWAVLHGICGLATQINENHSDLLSSIFLELKVLLPCIRCRESYESMVSEEILMLSKCGWFTFVYNLHNQVNDKLEEQRLEAFKAVSKIKYALKDEHKKLSNRPSLEVVGKRFALSDGVPFSEDDVWKCLFSFVMVTDGNPMQRRKSLRIFVNDLIQFLTHFKQYENLVLHLIPLHDNLDLTYTSEQGFRLVAISRYKVLQSKIDLQMLRLPPSKNMEMLWINYSSNITAGKCGTFTCE